MSTKALLVENLMLGVFAIVCLRLLLVVHAGVLLALALIVAGQVWVISSLASGRTPALSRTNRQ